MKRLLLAAALLLAPLAAHAQVRQTGSVTPGHLTCWNGNSVVQDCGTPENPAITGGIGQINGNQASTATNSTNFPNFNQFYTGITTDGIAHIGVRSFGSAPASSLQFEVDGVVVPILPTPPLTTTDGSTSVPATTTLDFTSGCTVSSAGTGIAHVACTTPPASLTTRDGSTSVPNTTTIDFTVGCTVSSGGTGIANVSCVPAITWPATNSLVVSNGTNTPAGLAPSGTGCVQTVSGAPFIIGACGGAASITITDTTGTTINGVSTENFGPGFLVTGANPTGTVNLNQPNRLATTCSGTPSPCRITQNDLGGQVTYNGSSLTATIPAISAGSFTGTISSGTLTFPSATGTVAIGQGVYGVGVANGTVITAGSGLSWTVSPSQSVSAEAMTSSFGASGAGFRIMNINASDLTLASGSTINGFPGGASGTVPFDGGIDCLSTGAVWYCGGIGFQPGQAFTNRDQTWSPSNTQTWGLSKVPHNPQTGTTYTLSSADCGIPLDIANASPITVTIPGTLPLDCFVPITQTGAGQITLVTSTGATIDGPAGISKTRLQWSTISVTINTNGGGTTAHAVVGGDGA